VAEVRGFQGVRYAGRTDLTPVVCPPYDVISPALRAELAVRDAANFVHLELPAGSDPYAAAAGTYAHWLASGIVARDPEPSLYLYGQEFVDPRGMRRRRLGILAALRLAPYEAGVVLPHERTFPKHKEDRYRLLAAAQAQFSPIFGLYATAGGVRVTLDRFASDAPTATAEFDGVRHLLWRLPADDVQPWLDATFADRQVFIADGHHRYETALRYQQERRERERDAPLAWFDYVMIYLVEMGDPGLVCEPTHRLASVPLPAWPELAARLGDDFAWDPVDALPDPLPDGEIGVLTVRGAARVRPRRRFRPEPEGALEVAILHEVLLPRLYGDVPEFTYVHTLSAAAEAIRSGQAQVAFCLPPPRLADLRAMAAAGRRMPQKSTYFWPKAIAGLVVYDRGALP